MKVNTSYEPYSQEPEYIGANKDFLQSLPLDTVATNQVLDLACGTGTLTELLFELRPNISVIGMDISTESLEIGRKVFRKKNLLVDDRTALVAAQEFGKGGVMLMEGSAAELDWDAESFDLVMMGNAIHLMSDRDKFLQGVNRVLRRGGLFAFNSAFFVGTFAEGTEHVYTEWLKEALAVLDSKNEELRKAGQPTIPRQRGKGGRAFSKKWMTPEQWGELLGQHGLEVVQTDKRTVIMTQRSFETVGAYSGLAEVLMSGYPVEIASECLQEAAGRAFRNLGITEIPRYWLEITAQKQ
jgi:ubiquinone/menaquinone biosynthesis C-methylase UbiE